MTNKPMLSVELRKALADFIEYSVPGPRSDDAMWYADKQALRALLDAQHVVCSNGILCQNSKCAECGGNGAYKPAAWERDMDYRPEEIGSPETEPACRTCNDTKVVDDGELTHSSGGIPYECGPIKCVKDCPDCKPAAQHQGEPVRWERMSKMMGGAWWPCANKAEADEAVTCGWTVRPLFAEQPAPVACTSCDGSGEYIDAIGDWRGYCECPAGVVAKNRTYPPAPSSAELDIESAAKKLAECMDYPWQHMTDQGRQSMRNFAKLVIEAGAGVKP